jgi:cell wall-associated NlpC family hydrolase
VTLAAATVAWPAFPFWRYAKIPYANGGRGRDGADCWGLFRLIYLEQFGISLPDYATTYRSAEDVRAVARALNDNLEDGWRRLGDREEPQPGDGVTFAPDLPQITTHVGVVVGRILGDLSFIHVRREGMSASVESLSRPFWRGARRGFYRNLQLERARCNPTPPSS